MRCHRQHPKGEMKRHCLIPTDHVKEISRHIKSIHKREYADLKISDVHEQEEGRDHWKLTRSVNGDGDFESFKAQVVAFELVGKNDIGICCYATLYFARWGHQRFRLDSVSQETHRKSRNTS